MAILWSYLDFECLVIQPRSVKRVGGNRHSQRDVNTVYVACSKQGCGCMPVQFIFLVLLEVCVIKFISVGYSSVNVEEKAHTKQSDVGNTFSLM